MTPASLDEAYFDGIFRNDDDPWSLASSDYEAAKFRHTHDVLADRRYESALEVGCAHGVLTQKLVSLCDRLLAIDISSRALAMARERVGDRRGVSLKQMAFPKAVPEEAPFDLVILSEVVYYWDLVDLDRAALWLRDSVTAQGRVILVHYVGETDYPHSADEAVEALWEGLQDRFSIARGQRCDRYRLDLWERDR
jgi:SAM-dependent methyltransferase